MSLSRILLAVLAIGSAGAPHAGASDALYFPAQEVAAAFDKGAVLFEGARYMVHSSRRDAAGQAEVHLEDADIIYVLEGSAVFVTGGSIVDGSSTGPGEIRGSSIAGGVSRKIIPGDVLIVPEGTPHWFKQVDGVIKYYVVKSRRGGA